MLTGEDQACLVDDPGEAGEWSQLATQMGMMSEPAYGASVSMTAGDDATG